MMGADLCGWALTSHVFPSRVCHARKGPGALLLASVRTGREQDVPRVASSVSSSGRLAAVSLMAPLGPVSPVDPCWGFCLQLHVKARAVDVA